MDIETGPRFRSSPCRFTPPIIELLGESIDVLFALHSLGFVQSPQWAPACSVGRPELDRTHRLANPGSPPSRTQAENLATSQIDTAAPRPVAMTCLDSSRNSRRDLETRIDDRQGLLLRLAVRIDMLPSSPLKGRNQEFALGSAPPPFIQLASLRFRSRDAVTVRPGLVFRPN